MIQSARVTETVCNYALIFYIFNSPSYWT